MLAQDSWEVVQQWGAAGAARPGAAAAEDAAVVACLSFWDYSLVAQVRGSDAYKATGRCFSVAAGRISFTFALKGAPLLLPSICPALLGLHTAPGWTAVLSLSA